MSVDYETFLQWATDRFGDENIKLKRDEICTHSFFTVERGMDQDFGYHLWMNPSGGKDQLPHGVYRCWKTDAMGSLVSLVSMLDNIPFDEAEEFLCGSLTLRSLEMRVEAFFRNLGHHYDDEPKEPPVVQEVGLPPSTILISKLPPGSFFRNQAEKYLLSRKIPIDGLFVCVDGRYKNRIVIPYYDRDGKLIWFNARSMDKKSKMKYMKPEGDGLSQDNVLYFPKWPPKGAKVYVTEGEFDSKVLAMAGFYSCACGGAHLSPTQMQILRNNTVVMAFDNDEDNPARDAGKQATIDTGEALLGEGFQPFYVRPPVGFKDWNALLEKYNIQTVKSYVDKYEKPFTGNTASLLLMG
jgi:DNA primase